MILLTITIVLQASNGSAGDGARKRSSTFSQMQSKGYLDRVKEKRREVVIMMMIMIVLWDLISMGYIFNPLRNNLGPANINHAKNYQ